MLGEYDLVLRVITALFALGHAAIAVLHERRGRTASATLRMAWAVFFAVLAT